MSFIFQRLKYLDKSVLILAVILSVIGIISIWGGGLLKNSHLYSRQILFLSIGLSVLIFLSFLDYRLFKNYSLTALILYFLGLALLVGVLYFSSQIRGVYAWFRLGSFTLEPSEFIKPIIIILLAKYFSQKHVEIYRISHIIASGIYVAIPSLLIFFQPDIGNLIILFIIWLGITLVAGIKWKQFLLLLLSLFMIFLFLWFNLLMPYQKVRILTFLNPYIDPKGYGYNIIQSKIAIGKGGLYGSGLEDSFQSRLKFLPEAQTDFAFAKFSEQFGFLGVIALFSLFLFFIWRILKISFWAQDNFSKLFAAGAAIYFAGHLVISSGINLGLFPITGISLTFLSYGGSNMLTSFIILGLLQSIVIKNKLHHPI